MSIREAAKLIDKEATYRVGEFAIPVRIVDFKNSYGRDKVQITPIHGSGEQWVMLESVNVK